jgi:2-polyprenyl-3-methyl-5-hydroxy-6-metoxy-1,4-benzoquinol methylase
MDEAAIRKREAWAQRQGVQTYIQEMGRYALLRDEQVVTDMLGHGPGRLLDMPCGTGRFLELEKQRGFTVTAADYSPTMLSVARQHAGVEVTQADIFNPPFAPESFDAILICRLMFHYAQPENILRGLLPALRPGGRIIFDTLNPFSSRWLASQLLRPVRSDPARRLYFQPHRRMRQSLRQMGLELLERRSQYILPTRLYRYLPMPVCKALGMLEKAVPPSLRVLTYWHVRRPSKDMPAPQA